MSAVFADLNDEELAAEIATLRTAIRGRTPGVKSVAGEGRRVEYENVGPRDLRRLLREALELQEKRSGGMGGHAIGVSF